jgi:hypothetical protein
MAWFLLNKDIEALVSNIRQMKEIGYTMIQKHIEEAVLIYYDIRKIFPDLYGLHINPETNCDLKIMLRLY